MKKLLLLLALTGCGVDGLLGEPFYGAQAAEGVEASVEGGDEIAAGDSGQDAADSGIKLHPDSGFGQDAQDEAEADGSPDTGSTTDSALADAADAAPETSCTPLTHSNGLGQTYEDCAPLGTYDSTTAMEACTAWAQGKPFTTTSPTAGCLGCNLTPNNGVWGFWDYSQGPARGHVSTVYCPSASDPTWD